MNEEQDQWTMRRLPTAWLKGWITVQFCAAVLVPQILDWPAWTAFALATVTATFWLVAMRLRRCPECRRRMQVREDPDADKIFHDCVHCRIVWDPRIRASND